ncbi:MAG: molybdopterin-dependent oxidoreductase [Acidimicrobiales bacterium]
MISRWQAAIAGTLAAGTALAVTELVTAPGNRGPSLITAVGSRFIDRFGASLKDFAVSVFGTNDKPALIIGIVVTCLVLGAALGIASRQRRGIGIAGICAIAAFGLWAGLIDPLASTPRMTFGAFFGAVAGVGALTGLLRVAAAPIPRKAPAGRRQAEDPRVKLASRRTFLGLAGATAAFAVTATAVGRSLRGTASAARERVALLLPAAKRVVDPPASQPFTVNGLTPYITANDDFYRIDTALIVPQIDPSNWMLKISGMVDHPLSITFDELIAMDMVEEPITMQCVSNEVGGDLIGTAMWRGVPLRDLLTRAGVRPEATQIVGRSADGFTAGFPTEKALDGRSALVVVGMNGEPLPASHGFPARLVIAGLYGYVSATKWLREIQLTRLEDFDGYWISRGWSKNGPIKTQSRIDVPRSGATVAAGPVAIAGVAWAPTRGIERVEVRVDAGEWVEARLGQIASDNTWVQWMTTWEATRGGHTISVRATDRTGAVQTDSRSDPAPDGATGYHQRRISVG